MAKLFVDNNWCLITLNILQVDRFVKGSTVPGKGSVFVEKEKQIMSFFQIRPDK